MRIKTAPLISLGLSAAVIISASFLGSSFARAQISPVAPDRIILTAIPPRLGDEGDLTAKPGEKIQTAVRIRNSSSQPITIESTALDFVVGDDGETPMPITDEVSNRWSLASWIIIAPNTQTLDPGETGLVNLVIDVPTDALPGGHYAMVMHQPLPAGATSSQDLQADSSALIAQRVGSLVYLKVEGPINEEAFLRDIQFPKLTEYGPVPFSYDVENVSDIHIRPQVTVDVYNIFGQKVDSITIETKNVFPYVSRGFEGQWDRVWGIGPYTAKFTMSFGSEGKIAQASVGFWLLPYKIVAGIAAGIVLLIAILLVVRTQIHRRRATERERVQKLEEKIAELESDRTHHEE